MGVASTTREPEAKGLDGVAAAPEDREPRPLAGGAAKEAKAAGVFFDFPPCFFFTPVVIAGAGGGEDAVDEAGGEGSERADPCWVLEEDDVD